MRVVMSMLVVIIVMMSFFSELCLVCVGLISVRQAEFHSELVRLWNVRDGFQKILLSDKSKKLGFAIGPMDFQSNIPFSKRWHDRFSVIVEMETKARWHVRFKNGDFDHGMPGVNESPALRPFVANQSGMGFGHPGIPSRSDEHPCRDADDDHPGSQLKIGFRCLRVPLTTIVQRHRSECPNNERMRDRSGDPQQNGLENRTPNRHDKRGHHGLGMPWFQAMQRAEKNCAWDEKPCVGRTVLKKL